MSKRNKGARSRARKAKLAALRAEVVLLFEEKLDKCFLQYNIQTTQKLIDDFRLSGAVPLWAQRYVRLSKANDPTSWLDDDEWMAKYQQAFDQAMVTGTRIIDLTQGR